VKDVMSSPECSAAVLTTMVGAHQRWHDRLRQALRVAGVDWVHERVDREETS
jgi:hypothetical protein